MAILSKEQIVNFVKEFLPEAMKDNIFITSILAGAATIAILLMTPAFAPVGVVGATGWIIVYVVTGGTFTTELVKRGWNNWKKLSKDQREEVDSRLQRLKKALDEGDITQEEYKEKAQDLLNKIL
jgi:hypothetical protein